MNIKQQLCVYGFIVCALPSCTYYFGPNQLTRHFKSTPSTIAAVYNAPVPCSATCDYDIHHPVIDYYANKPLPNAQLAGQTDAIRIMIAKLVQRRDVEAVNELLLTLYPWSEHGTQWALHPHGDYDFTEITMCSLLYLFGDKPDLLYPKTREHLLHILIGNSGAKQSLRTPGSAGLMRETENHILMGEVSRYLKNQWLYEHGDTAVAFDNQKNGIEKWMLNHLDEKFRGGFFEFNSDPYSGYSMQALLTLYSFTHSDTIRLAANKLLNEVMYEYSLNSINQSRYTVFRRQVHRASETSFEGDPVSSVVRVLVSLKTGAPLNVSQKQHGLITLLLHYRLNDTLTDLLVSKHQNYFAMLGHGYKGSPEIYTGGNGYVLSAGGVQRGLASQLASRPVMLLLNDHVMHADSCFSLCSKGKRSHWNNTGVYYNFACANQPVHIPPQYIPVVKRGGWQLFYAAEQGLSIITYSEKHAGLLMVTGDGASMLETVINTNMTLNLKKQFMLPGKGMITYKLNSSKSRWVIESAGGKKTDRKFDQWRRVNYVQTR